MGMDSTYNHQDLERNTINSVPNLKSVIHRLRKCQSFGFGVIAYTKFYRFVLSIM